MKRITIILFSLILTLPIAAQKKTLELGIYGGLQTYTKIGNPYENSFSSGFGIGFISKYYLNSAVFFLVRKFYMLRCLFGTLYVDMRCFGVSCFFSKHKIPHPNQWGILKPQRNTVYSRKTSE